MNSIINEDKKVVLSIALFFGCMYLFSTYASATDTSFNISGKSTNALSSNTWPKFHHDNQNTGQSTYLGPQSTPKAKWNFKTGGANFVPSVGKDGTLYFGCMDKYLYAVTSDGKQKWRYKTGDYVFSSPAIASDGTIYFGSGDKYFYALTSTGHLKWKFKTNDFIDFSPSIANDGTIIFLSGDKYGGASQYFYALSPAGKLKWKYQANGSGDQAISSDGTIYFCINEYLYAISSTGKYKWKYKSGDIANWPVIGKDGTIYFGSWDNNLYAVSSTGKLKWKYKTYGNEGLAIAKDGTIYFIAGNYLYALSITGKLKWKYYHGDLGSSPVMGNDGSIYFGSGIYIYAISSTGKIKWKYFSGGNPNLILGKNQTIYYVTYDNYMKAIHSPFVTYATPKGGFYKKQIYVTLKMNRPGHIYYTYNGTTPSTSSPKYARPILIKKSTTLKYLAIDLEGNKSRVYTERYIY
jgi:outer membrane protein assembly factor BamB